MSAWFPNPFFEHFLTYEGNSESIWYSTYQNLVTHTHTQLCVVGSFELEDINENQNTRDDFRF